MNIEYNQTIKAKDFDSFYAIFEFDKFCAL